MGLALAGVITAAVLAGVGILTGVFEPTPSVPIAHNIIYTAPISTDAEIELPSEVIELLHEDGLAGAGVAVSRVDSDGTVDVEVVDMTPRVDDSKDSAILNIPERAAEAIDKKIDTIEKSINNPASGGDRALFSGLTKLKLADAPTIIVSSGLDLADPVSFPSLAWTVPVEDVVANVKDSGERLNVSDDVTFVVVPSAGAQPQLRDLQSTYRNDVWTGVLQGGGASSVRFIDAVAVDTADVSGRPEAPVVSVPPLPITPVGDPADPKRATCSVPSAFFVVNEPTLLDEEGTVAALRDCIENALAAGATFELDGHTSYSGPLDGDGRPAIALPENQTLSEDRVDTIADTVMIDRLGVPADRILARRGHGNVDQPVPDDPGSPENRRVDITFTTP
ncbi:hypothetical protein GTU73_01850 [Rathayibacter sp. VKM Ac-2804]|uniref:hypothetical protein n=1 Tax=Rathayibacter sp. VKM Ac-2804 TaxID=2609257 RepID=UPI00132EAA7D|nr:hypothetical protein [Rathayibacter sp. VKM Ac-2804]QHF22870.1 hypothetical protein GTU73_01850 [Rathayibacter sp. VKM Ac-2804]